MLQEMREHTDVAGERTLLGALHRQLRAEHLPALVEMALSRDRSVAEQAFEEIAIVAAYTNRHRPDVARVFAGRAEPPERVQGTLSTTGTIRMIRTAWATVPSKRSTRTPRGRSGSAQTTPACSVWSRRPAL